MPLPTVTQKTSDGRDLVLLTTQGANAVPYLELLTYSEDFQEKRQTATRTCLCLWSQRLKFVADILGTATYVNPTIYNGVQSNIHQSIPEIHPDMPWMIAKRCSLASTLGVPVEDEESLAIALTTAPNYGELSQVDPATFMVRFNLAQYTVEYADVDYFSRADSDAPNDGRGELARNMSIYYTTAGSNQPYPATGFQYVGAEANGSHLPVMSPPVATLSELEARYLWRRVPGLPVAAIQNTIGHCNRELFDNYWPPQTMLLLPPKIERYFSCTGDVLFDIEFLFLYRPQTHNALLRRTTKYDGGIQFGQVWPIIDPPGTSPGFEYITGINDDGSTTPPTRLADFGKLFVLP